MNIEDLRRCCYSIWVAIINHISNERASQAVSFGHLCVSYLDALQLWVCPRLEVDEPENFVWQQDGAWPHMVA